MQTEAISNPLVANNNYTPLAYALGLLALTLFLALAATPLKAAPNSDIAIHIARHYPANIEQQRQNYQLALEALEKRNMEQYQLLREQLDTYPLRVYLDYRAMANSIDSIDKASIEQYQQAFRDTGLYPEPFVQRLNAKRLHYLAKNQQWPAFIALYSENNFGKQQTTLQCHYATALLATGSAEAAYNLAQSLWLAPRSQPKACDHIFEAWRQSADTKAPSTALAWRRFTAAFANNQIALAKYLLRYLDTEHHGYAQQLIRFYQQPKTIAAQWPQLSKLRNQFQSDKNFFKTQKALLKRAIRSDLENSEQIFNQLRPYIAGDAQLATLINNLKAYAIQRYALKDYKGLAELYDKLGKPSDSTSIEWMIRSSLAGGKWREAADYIALLPDQLRAHERWRYWQLRTAQLQTTLNNAQRTKFTKLAGKASFYGFYSANLMQLPATIAPQTATLDAATVDQLLDNSRLTLALEYFKQGQINEANNHWFKAIHPYSTAQKVNAAYLASHYDWHNQAINTLAFAKAWQHYAVRFPNYMGDSFEQHGRLHNQPANWFYATARQESALAQNAHSSAGALGLMQILPSTAKAQAKSLAMKYQRELLFDPHYSIAIGSAYLDSLYNRYNNRALSSAAYNAGPGRVDKWLANLEQAIPLDAWIESIRFSETRQYVQNILSFSLIHSTLHSKNKTPAYAFAAPHFIASEELVVKPLAQQLATQLAQNAR